MTQDGIMPDRLSASAKLRRRMTLGVPTDSVSKLSHVVDLVAASLAERNLLLVTFVNPSSRAVARRQAEYADQLSTFDAVLPDGSGMCTAMRWLHGRPALRVSFDTTSLAPEVLGLAERHGYTVALAGGVPGRAEAAGMRFKQVFPQLRLVGTFDGYSAVDGQVQAIAGLNPDIVICGMSPGRQEGLLLALARAGWKGCGFTCGGYFDQLGAGFDYYPSWIDRTNLRWAYRLAKEPRRLWRRYVYTYPPFVLALCRALVLGGWPSSDKGLRHPVAGQPRTDFLKSSPDDAFRIGAQK
jgi:exopolysaccharide biosynthesis WecB/TagA/CpsF family protein